MPRWLQRTGAISWRLLVIAALGAVLIWTAFLLGTVTASILLSVIVAATVAPVMRRLRGRGWSTTKASAVVTAAAVLIVLGVLLLLLRAFVSSAPDMVEAMRSGLDELRDDLAALGLPPETAAWVQFAADGIRSWIVAGISALASGVAAWATIGILTVFLTFFVLRDGVQAWAWLLQATPARKRERIEASSRDALERVGGYLRGTAILSAALAVAYGAFLVLLGVPTPGLLAVVVFLGGFVPYLGNFVAMIVVLLVALSTVGPQTTLILLILMMVAHSLLNNLLRPVVYGRSVHLHPALVLIALPVGAAMAGIVGLFAAIPVTAVARRPGRGHHQRARAGSRGLSRC